MAMALAVSFDIPRTVKQKSAFVDKLFQGAAVSQPPFILVGGWEAAAP
jgi:hypothetical protein